MSTYLVVGNQTLGSNELLAALRARAKATPAGRIHVVVPQTPLDHYARPLERSTLAVGGHAETVAEHQLATALEDFKDLGITVTGEIGHENPLRAVEEVAAREEPDEVIVSTFPPGASRWLGASLPERIGRKLGLPVTHVVGQTYDEDRREARKYEEVRRQLGLADS